MTTTLISGALAFISIFVLWVWQIKRKAVLFQGKPVGYPPTTPFLGNILQFVWDREHIYKTWNGWLKLYAPEKVFQFYIGWKPTLVVCDPILSRQIMTNFHTTDRYTKWPPNDVLSSVIGRHAVGVSEGPNYKVKHDLLAEYFRPNNIGRLTPSVCASVNKLIKKWNKTYLHSTGTEVNLMDEILKFSLDSLFKTVLNADLGAMDGRPEAQEMLDGIASFTKEFVARLMFPLPEFLLNRMERVKTFNEHRDRLVRWCEDQLKKQSKKTLREDHIVSLFFEATQNGSLSEKDAIWTLMPFLLDGNAAITLAMSLWCISNDKVVQEKVFYEANSVIVVDEETGNLKIREDDVRTCLYVDAVIKETMRLYSTAIAVSRYCKKGDKIGDYVIPPGTDCILYTLGMQIDGSLWEEPEKFNPKRWLENTSKNVWKDGGYAPFGMGNRKCMGQHFAMLEMKIAILMLVKRFSFDTTNKTPDLVFQMGVGPKEGVFAIVQRR